MTQLFATNLGAGGIDVRCAPHLEDVLMDADNIAAGVAREDYVPVAADDGAACEACASIAAAFTARAEAELQALIERREFGSAQEVLGILAALGRTGDPDERTVILEIGERLLFALAFARASRRLIEVYS